MVDVAASKMAVQHLKRHSNSKSNDGYHVPQVFVGGEYRGVSASIILSQSGTKTMNLLAIRRNPSACREWNIGRIFKA